MDNNYTKTIIMKRIKTLSLLFAFFALTINANAQKYVGGDISLLPTYEEHGVHYLGSGGNNQQVQPLEYWGDSAKWNAMRVRLFVDPSKASASDQAEGVRQDLDYVTRLGKRIKDDNYAFMLDFHYSDTWTDPGQHSTPASWNSTDPDVLADSVYEYTKRVLQHLVANGATPDFIQPGNEVTYGMMWPTGRCYPSGANYDSGTFANFVKYLQAGIRACKEICPNAKIVIQTEMSRAANVTTFYNTLENYTDSDGKKVDYDIIGISYYPDWHGPLSTLRNTLNTLESQHADKNIMIVETGYESKWQLGNPTYTPSQLGWEVSEAGQKQFAADLVDELNKHSKVTGLFWWAPEDNEFWADKNPARSSWWNASLYTQNTGKPLPAMFELQRFLDGGTTGISSISTKGDYSHAKKKSTNVWYTLQGQQISKPSTKGLYINEGKKIAIK